MEYFNNFDSGNSDIICNFMDIDILIKMKLTYISEYYTILNIPITNNKTSHKITRCCNSKYFERMNITSASIERMIIALKRIFLLRRRNCVKKIQYDNYHSIRSDAESDCLSNKCVNMHYIYNEKEPITHFDDIYIPPQFIIKESSYIYNSKTWGCQCESIDVHLSKNSNEDCTLLCFGPPCFEGSTSNTPISNID
ncbi:hypothetical protein H8356DRAFT_1350332 [Neocallimastix lanati (nom. inval.)]|nr:hypothetical protein H8356DRAFT_1350332 [Neocallimastix sp. JGI-2020a]